MRPQRSLAGIGGIALIGAALTLSGCAPGNGSSSPGSGSSSSAHVSADVAGAGKVTLTEWDQDTSGSENTLVSELNDQFMKKYPNVKIVRVSRSFNDLKTTLKLALSSPNPPDVVQANQGYPDMGAFVQAGLLMPLNPYATLYGWRARFPAELLDINSFTPDGKTWHTGSLYGLSQTGEAVGVFYNKQILRRAGVTPPTTFQQFAASLPVLKKAGVLPISYGDSDLTMGIHLYGIVQDAMAGASAVRDLVYAKGGSWTGAANVQAAQIVQQWAKDGYLTPGANGVSEAQATSDFGAGKAAYEVDGPWEGGTLASAMGGNAGFIALKPSATSTGPVTQGGIGLAWAITSKSAHPDVAAAYINFLTDAGASKVMVDVGALPAVAPAGWQPTAGSLESDLENAWNQVSADDGLTPYLDYTTPTFYNTLTAAIQELTGQRVTPAQFAATLQQDYQSFLASNK
jgi:raffinose/stachyose/melibiose transport system substrate-binding protein